MDFIERLKASGFKPFSDCYERMAAGKLVVLSNEMTLAYTISDLIDSQGPQFVAHLTRQLVDEFRGQVSINGGLHDIVRSKNPFYKQLGIMYLPLFEVFEMFYPEQEIKNCRGVSFRHDVLYKTEDSLKEFVDEKFAPPTRASPFWQYMPEMQWVDG